MNSFSLRSRPRYAKNNICSLNKKLLQNPTFHTKTKKNYTTLTTYNSISCITHTQQKTKNLVFNKFNLVVGHKQLNRFLVIQKPIHLQQHKNPSPKHRNQNICVTKKTTMQKLCFKTSSHQKWFEVTQDGIISHEKYLKPCSHLN